MNEVLRAEVDLSLTLPCHVPLDAGVGLINGLSDITQLSLGECSEIASPHVIEAWVDF